jgi:hypothetical protein
MLGPSLNIILAYGILHNKHLIDSIDAVQRRFTKRIPSLSSLSYSERLASINLESLELRRLCFDLIMYYKIINIDLTKFLIGDVFSSS